MKPQTLAHRQKIGATRIGHKHWNWQGGKTKETNLIRNSLAYKEWRKAVSQRDNYVCQLCAKKGGSLEADHIKPFWKYHELRLELSNGRTLCEKCHRKQPTYSKKADKLLLENELIQK